ncbi:MAG: response regulator transcription factor [Microcystaceae cyanobacterium]
MGTALVIEDSATERSIISDFCEKLKIQVVIAVSGEEGLKALETLKPDVIILDVVLPGLSGFEICRKIKEMDHTKTIPIVLCSTKGTEMDKFWGKRQGADGYITKPIDQKIFTETITKFVKT